MCFGGGVVIMNNTCIITVCQRLKKRNTRWTFIPFYFFLQQKVPLHGLQAIYFLELGTSWETQQATDS